MRRVQAQSHTHFWPIFNRMLLGRSSNPQVLEVILLLAEALIFTYYIASSYKPVSQLGFQNYSGYVLAAVIVTLLIRYLVNATICRLIFLPTLFCVFTGEFDETMKAIILILLFINCLIDIIANIEYEFMTQNPYSQSLNQTKFLHKITLIVGTLIRTNQETYFHSQTYIGDIILLILFMMLILLKLGSTCQNEWNKQIHLRFYLLCLCYYFRNVVIVWQNSLGTNYQHLIVIVVSQVLYFVIAKKFNQLQVDIEISKNNICHLVFSIMSYQYSLVYDEDKEKAIVDLNPDRIAVSKTHMKKRLRDEDLPVNSGINPEYEQPETQKVTKNGFISQIMDVSQANKKTGMRAEQILRQAYDQKTDNAFRCLFLIAQIKLNVFNNMISSKKIIHRLNSQCSSIYWIDRICLYKFEQRLYDEIQKRYELNEVCQFEQFLENEDFRTMLVKNSYEYLALWRYLLNVDFLFKKLSKLLNKVLKRKYQVNKFYNELKVKCSTTVLLFIDYLYMVRRDVVNTLRICRSFQIYQESHHMLQVENKIYICINYDQNVLMFENVSYNVKKLLGYDRSLIKNAPISMLLPAFFVEAHQKLVNNEINLNNQGLYLMRKTVIAKHFDGYYLLANILTKMIHSQDGSIKMQGYLQIKNDESYNWPNYFVVKQPEGQIIQIGAPLKDVIYILPRKTAFLTEYFDDKPTDHDLLEMAGNESKNQHKKYLYNNGIEYEYELIRTLTAPDIRLAYYVSKNNLIDMPSEMMVRESKNKMVESTRQPTRFPKFSIKFEDFETNLQQYFKSKTELIKNMKLKPTMIILIIAIVLILGALAMQIILIQRVELIRQQNNVIQTDMSNLVEFYHTLQNLGMIANQIAVESNLGIVYTYDYYNITQLSLSIQKVNEKLSKFDKQLYGEIGDIAINYPKPFHDVLLDFTVNYFVRGYTGGDKQLNKIAQKDAHAFFKYIYGDGLDDYLDVFNEEVISFNNEDNRIKIGLGASIIVLMVIVFFMMVRIDAFKRNYEYETLDLLSTINATPIFANSITQFLRRAIGGINQKEFESDWNMQKTKQDQNTSFLNKNEITSNISARQNSVRNFFQDDLNSTNRQQKKSIAMNTLQQKQKVERDENQRREQKIKPISKIFLLVWSLLILIVIGVCIAWIITDQKGNQIELPKSISSLLTILNRQILFSSQIITYIDMLTHQTSSQLYDLNVQKFNNLNDLTYTFQESKYAQFTNFTNLLQKVTYVYLCEYMVCNANYKDYINIIYNSAIHKLNNYMTENMQQSVLTQKSYEMQALWYSHKLMENTINELLVTYLKCYRTFDENRSSSYYLFYYCQISALVVCMLFVLYVYCCNFLGERKKYFRMLGLVKFESYDIKEPQVI